MIESVSGQMVRPIRPAYGNINIEIHMTTPQNVSAPHQGPIPPKPHRDEENVCPNCGYYYDVPRVSIYTTEPKDDESKKSNVSDKVLTFPQQTVIEKSEVSKVHENSGKVTNPISSKKPETIKEESKKDVENKNAESKKTPEQNTVKEPKEAEPKKIEVVKPQDLKPVVDINTFITELTNPDYARQADAMNVIAQVCDAAPEIAAQLIDVRVIDTLLGIINADTSNLAAPTQRQMQIRHAILNGQNVSRADRIEASVKAPVELAEQNKEYAIYTLAAMQKVYGAQVEKMGGKTVPLTDLPGAKEIINEVKTNANPHIRAAGLGALNYVRTPQYSSELQNIYQKASVDENPVVRAVAQRAIELNA